MRTLKLGTRGPDVAAWQTFLQARGFDPGKADGAFGPRTEAATKAYQASEGLKPDGIAGQLTLGRAGLNGHKTLRRLKQDEVTPAITANAKRIIKEHRSDPYGTEVPFEADGQQYVARIEEHHHEPGGPQKPWGYHPGVSVLAVVSAELEDVEEEPAEEDADTIPVPPPESETPAGFRLGATSRKRLEGVHPDLVMVLERAIEITPIDFVVVDGVRTLEQQKKNVANGASKTMNSRHLTGHAVDIAPIVDGKVSYHWPHYRILRVPMLQAAKELGIPLRSGANWDQDENWEEKGETDGPHWELPRSAYP